MKKGIKGPDCTDPEKCKGDCCSIKIDVPKVLAKEYIERGYASKKDFIRSNNFSFQLRFDENTGKCFLFNKEKNGCEVHSSGIKPPQCWIYPTNFSNPQAKEISCKKLSGWEIIDPKKTLKAEKLLQKYVFLSKLEAKEELRQIHKRLNFIDTGNIKNLKFLTTLLRNIAPSRLGGFKDSWESFEILYAEGLSMQMKKFCLLYKKNCNYLPDDFFECKSICNDIIEALLDFLNRFLLKFILENGLDVAGEYPLYKLLKYMEKRG